jgi:serine/threonine-protein kinase
MALLEQGENLHGTYEVERYLGEGAFAEVYRVQHRILGRQAMKVFKRSGVTEDQIVEMLSEAILLSKIGHPNLIRVFDANVLERPEGPRGFFTMEYVAGGTLDRLWRSYRKRLMPVDEAVAVIRQVCSGLAVAHDASPPIVHRDLKPQNLLVGYDGAGLRVRVSDFGLAKQVHPLTLLASARGTLGFKPPEAFSNMDSPASDVWALGTTLYLLLTDRMPFPMLANRDLDAAGVCVGTLRPPSFYNICVDPLLEKLITRCLQPDPASRYPDARALLEALEVWTPGAVPAEERLTMTTASKPGLAREDPEAVVKEALQLARDPSKLMAAADLLEEAINKDPSLRERYEIRLRNWRRGVVQ